jgi:hypothetical protein
MANASSKAEFDWMEARMMGSREDSKFLASRVSVVEWARRIIELVVGTGNVGVGKNPRTL